MGPDKRTSIKELKLREFRDRKKLLNPYTRDQLMQSSANPEELQKVADKVSVKTMYTFNISYDRHVGQYGYRTHGFPDRYSPGETSLNYAKDPDWE